MEMWVFGLDSGCRDWRQLYGNDKKQILRFAKDDNLLGRMTICEEG
jgi:hypothetical protein